MKSLPNLPIDEILPELLQLLPHHSTIIIHAPPGAGKTTRVPLAFLNNDFLKSPNIIMLEPRRLAAVSAARWMAESIGENVGNTVGYTIRFEKKVSAATRVEVVTEGILTRRLQTDPFLTGVGVVIFDEFHERSLNSDLALALCRDVQQGLRDDLKIIVMSATLEGELLSERLGRAPVLESAGKQFPVNTRYLGRSDNPQGIAQTTSSAIKLVLKETEGDVLVFLPGAGEIKSCQRLLETEELPSTIRICPLYGDLPFEAQESAILPSSQRKVVLATNIAETSLTIEGVNVVIDSGWSRQLRFDPVSGLNRLETVRVSAASADQRRGRAGRLGPGVCYRLWDEHAQHGLIPFNPPEIRTSDLASLALDLALWGLTDSSNLCWIDPPPEAALNEGRKLLKALDAIDQQGLITSKGRDMAALPVHPRLAHMLLESRTKGVGAVGCDLAALLTERDILKGSAGAREASPSDLLDRLELLWEWRQGSSARYADRQACKAVGRAASHFRNILSVNAAHSPVSADTIGLLLAFAFPDRIAQQRGNDDECYLFANGRGGRLSKKSAVRKQQFIVAAAVEGGEGIIHLASALPIEVLRREFAKYIEITRFIDWDNEQGRVIARKEERFQSLLLSSHQIVPSPEEVQTALIRGIRENAGPAALHWSADAVQFCARVRFLARLFPEEGWPEFSDWYLLETLEKWLGPWLSGIKSLSELERIDLLPPLQSFLDWKQQQRLDNGAPTHIQVPSGSRIPLQYTPEGPPVLAVKLQELFGMAETPTVAWGKSKLLLHMLSPARRPIQVTQDLRSFWNTTYQDVKKELKGRYPKHPWPDDPWNAIPTRHTSKMQKKI